MPELENVFDQWWNREGSRIFSDRGCARVGFYGGWNARKYAAQQLAEAAPDRWGSAVVKPALVGRILEATPEISALQAERIARKLLEDGAA